ncbi:uncharacterized protein LOC132749546 [Ruditapes philippinarum]|uniref:uncharacterized protein LOC132749546 n=1 Tax=Ruditapes philippinarum TaxID=129788 RepID=UPI00295AFF72|nr:uncharacterized protein LOC132749546 [Ruditapes philippinarum]
MAEALSVSNKGRKLVCSICQKTFEEMTVSSCFHTFCLDCLRGQVSTFGRSTYCCPICKASVNLPGEVISDLTKDNYDVDDISSSSLNQTCDICSDGRMAINRCMQCQESLCHACTNAHIKMKASRYHRHQVIPLRDDLFTDDLERSRSLKYCWRHRNEEIKFVCKECDVVLCMICKLMEHKDHVTKPVSEEASIVREKLTSLLQRQVGLGEMLKSKVNGSESRETNFPQQFEQELSKLNFQASKMHAEIETEKQKVEKELKLYYGDNLSKYEKDKESLRRDFEEYSKVNTEALQLLNSKDEAYVVGKGSFLYKRLNEMEENTRDITETPPVKPLKHFNYGTIDPDQLQRMMGYVCEKKPQISQSQEYDQRLPQDLMNQREQSIAASFYGNLKLLSKFTVPFNDGIGYVYGIGPINQSNAWVTLLDHKTVTLMDTKGTIVSSVDVDDVCEDVTGNSDGDGYITCPRTKCIKRVTSYGQVNDVLAQLQQDPHGICLRSIGDTQRSDMITELYVCFTETRGATMPLFENQKGCLRVFSEDGDDLGRGFHLQAPVRVDAHADTNALCVSDYSNGCVTVCDLSGQYVKAIYTGEDDQEPFKPLGVCFDAIGNVIIADWSGNRVCLISQDGEYIKTLVSDIEGPQSVAFNNNLLWVGSKFGKVHVFSNN